LFLRLLRTHKRNGFRFSVSEKAAKDHFFEFFTDYCFSLRSRAAKAARYESLRAFIRFGVLAAEAGWNVKGCGP